MGFEYDPEKSTSNKRKHGIDFEEAKALFDDPRLLEFDAPSQSEARYVAVGKLGGKHWAAIFTRRGGAIRLISVRRARGNEVRIYEGA
ncbi:BrnT family toxin [Aurantimonas sp. 22II-16-19i]|uniref:BrnT family toxin n=1 Tax=Aurantimonas sp. 22II-16-19i TaxID=1317114 RepID=UPI0009F7D2EF|nr:BrnT family toxin [Aurantimonas sp. 22II-16-19i]ORE94034.1 hypothetical protein ATO4_14809 [Aurantimonas sp. 22II-16-19i]